MRNFKFLQCLGEQQLKKIKSLTKNLLKNCSLPKKISFLETCITTTPRIMTYVRLDSEKLHHISFIQVFLFTILKNFWAKIKKCQSECGQIIGLYRGGSTISHISKALIFAKTTVIRTIKNFQERDNVKELPRKWT